MGYVQRFLRDLQETKNASKWCKEAGIAKTTFSAVTNGVRAASPQFTEKLLKVLDQAQSDLFLRALFRDTIPEEFHDRFTFSSTSVHEMPTSAFPLAKWRQAMAYLAKRCERDPLLAEHLTSLADLIRADGE